MRIVFLSIKLQRRRGRRLPVPRLLCSSGLRVVEGGARHQLAVDAQASLQGVHGERHLLRLLQLEGVGLEEATWPRARRKIEGESRKVLADRSPWSWQPWRQQLWGAEAWSKLLGQ